MNYGLKGHHHGYKANIISTIVDESRFAKRKIGYKANIISTIVDEINFLVQYLGYKANIISTIVDLFPAHH